MQILEAKFGRDQVDPNLFTDLVQVVKGAGETRVGKTWRTAETYDRYKADRQKIAHAQMIENIRACLDGKNLALCPPAYPYDTLEKIFPGFWHFTLWTAMSEIHPMVAMAVFETVFPDRSRILFQNLSTPSLPEIPHVHGLVNLGQSVLSEEYKKLVWKI